MIRFALPALLLASQAHAAAKPIKLQLNPVAAKKAAAFIEIKVTPLGVVPPGFLGNRPPLDEGDDLLGDFVPVPKGPLPVLPGAAMAEIPEIVEIPRAQTERLDLRLKDLYDKTNARRRERDLVPAD